MNIDEISKKLNMKIEVQQAMSKHQYPICHTEKSGWFTNIDDVTQKTGKRKIRKSTEEKLWVALAKIYSNQLHQNISLKELYSVWINWKSTPLNKANIERLQYSWQTYYLDEPLSQTIIGLPICQLTSMELRTWAESLMQKYLPDNRKFSRIFTIINQCLEYASDDDIGLISTNLWGTVRSKLNKNLIVSGNTPSDETQVFTDSERKEIHNMVYSDLIKYSKNSSTAGLQILFLFETGLRIGECCGLKWSDIRHNRLYVRRQADNNGVKEWTKTSSGYRDIPLTEEALKLLADIETFNTKHKFKAEWIFQGDNPKYDYRLSYNSADRKLRKLCIRLDTEHKSPHKCRKTCISTLLDSPNISNRTVQRFAGHSDINTTMKFYSFERRNKQEQADAINNALKLKE